jgi:hypothetical protein
LVAAVTVFVPPPAVTTTTTVSNSCPDVLCPAELVPVTELLSVWVTVTTTAPEGTGATDDVTWAEAGAALVDGCADEKVWEGDEEEAGKAGDKPGDVVGTLEDTAEVVTPPDVEDTE